jgi:hypothetical protein
MALTTRLRRRREEEQQAGIAAEISGDVSGQLAVGSHIVQVSAQHGAIVNVAAPEQAPRIRARSAPAAIVPRAIVELLGRAQELDGLLAALCEAPAVELHGPGGIGKTALLRAICHDAATRPEHGVVFVRTAGLTAEDVGQQVFEALYESDVPVKPTQVELCTHLRDRTALVVLDDVGWDRDELSALMDWAPRCLFALAGEQRRLWGEGRSQQLGGLAPTAALALLERELGRPLAGEERERALELCRRLDGRPLGILQAAELARDGALPLADPAQLEQLVRARLDPPQQRALRVLETLRPAAVHADDLGAIAALPDAAAVLERLRAAGAAQANSPRWNVVLQAQEASPDEDAELAARAVAHLTRAADADAQRPLADVPALLAAFAAAARAQRWSELAAGVRRVDAPLTLRGRWGAWRIALEHARAAAVARGDARGEAWALHQLGTRAGCLGQLDAAVPRLERALALRRKAGDADGAAVTAHNLAVLGGSAGGGGGNGSTPPPSRPRAPATALLAGGAALVLAGGSATAVIVSHHHGSSHAPVAPVVSTPTTDSVRTGPPDTHMPPTTSGRGASGGTAGGTSGGDSDDSTGDRSGERSSDSGSGDGTGDGSGGTSDGSGDTSSDGTSTPAPAPPPVARRPPPIALPPPGPR